jgi:hypothetical protein
VTFDSGAAATSVRTLNVTPLSLVGLRRRIEIALN